MIVTVVVIRIISCAVCTSGPGDIQHLTLTLDVSIKTWQLEHIIVILFKCNITLKSNKMRTRHETKSHPTKDHLNKEKTHSLRLQRDTASPLWLTWSRSQTISATPIPILFTIGN